MPSSSHDVATYDGRDASYLASSLDLPRVLVFDEVASTLDVTHTLGERGEAAGTLVLADAQTAGRGRLGRNWRSDRGAGIWLTLLERPARAESLGVLALRLALAVAPALDRFAAEPTRLKWPNDVYIAERKLAGVLVEARWRGPRLDWVAIGVGINVRPPVGFDGAGLTPGAERVEVLAAVVPALRAAARAAGLLTDEELAAYARRDLAIGRECIEPATGIVAGIRADGALLVDTPASRIACHAGSLVLAPANSLGSAP
ncbi:MAG TPA: biotin--[acetyl-CoA-carboxylase] ligase [Gemmatimonadaceae bacterium]|nr:biotin--[acetyl-CoA-carboxylase] ligase [Gemmatimonadaceae bacterium]